MLIVDANVIVATMNRRDKNHERMSTLLEGRDDQFVVTPYVVAEVAYLVQKFAGPRPKSSSWRRSAMVSSTRRNWTRADLDRAVEIMRRFQDLRLGLADASIIAVAKRLKIREIASIDGHFRAVRPHGIDFFTLLP